MTGAPPDINSVNDYLTAVLPVCFGPLKMTADEIYRSTPWDINQRIRGYEERERQKRVLLGAMVTVPVINAGFYRPAGGVTLTDIVPDDLTEENITEQEIEYWKKVLDEARERR